MRRILRAAIRGAVSGAIGMIVMDVLWYSRYVEDGGRRDPLSWEFAAGVDSWDRAPAPAKVGRLAVKQVTGTDPDPAWVPTMNNIVHWLTGAGWGAVYGLLNTFSHPDAIPFTTLVWGLPYVALVPSGIYKPIWDYDVETIAKDYSAHILYGTSLALAYRLLR